MKQLLLPLALCLSVLLFTQIPLAAQDVVISEFMAINSNTIDDEDGDSSDWIELLNTTAAAIDLGGWYLTDEAANLTKWPFPSVSIAPGETLLVFASSKDRRDPASEFHTNFRLTGDGEYLGLVRPGGNTVEHDYSPAYPPQFEDTSYGLGQEGGTATVLIASDTMVNYTFPANNSNDVYIGGQLNPAGSWIETDFEDAGWSTGGLGIGYATGNPDAYDAFIVTDVQANMSGASTTIYMRAEFEVPDPGTFSGFTLRMRHDDGFVAYLNGVPEPIASANASGDPTTLAWNSVGVNHNDSEAIQYAEFVLNPVDLSLEQGTNVLAVHGLNQSTTSSDALWQWELLAESAESGLNGNVNYFTNPTPDDRNGSGTDDPGPSITETTDSAPRPISTATPPTTLVASVTEFSGVQGQDGWRYGYHEGAGAYDADTTFTEFAPQHWTGSQWDVNTGASAPWTALGATNTHPNDSTPGPKQATVRRWVSDLDGDYEVTGFFLNTSASGDGTTGRVFHNGTEIFSALSDGSQESFDLDVTLASGDLLDFMVDVGPLDQDGSDGTNFQMSIGAPGSGSDPVSQVITAKAQQTVNPLASVELKWRVMYSAEETETMVDDGTGDDETAGDGIYTATIVTETLGIGEMLRWRVVATDDQANVTTDPSFPDPIDSPEYYGTVAQNPEEEGSTLPILHWFLQNTGAADTDTGSRGSVYFLDQFYDNMLADIHGQSTRGFPKKSYDLDFNKGDRFRYMEGERRVKDINLLTNWADKSKTRNTIGYGSMAEIGVPCHWAFAVRVQRNGTFFSTADMVEDGDDRYLDRVGLSENGALYKLYSRIDGGGLNFQKKNRKEEGSADINALRTALNQSGAAELTYVYDNINIPGLVNYMTGRILISDRDFGHKNYYMYRDTEGSGEWMPLVWDIDLNWGRNWTSGPAYFDDTMTQTNSLTPQSGNQVHNILFSHPEIRAMYNRRLKTANDQILGPPGTVNARIEEFANEVLELVDPAGVVNTDADRDYTRWGSWGNQNRANVATARMISQHLPGRRTYIYNSLSGTIPASQPAMAPVTITMGEYSPASGNQLEEYFTLSHTNNYATDVSNWVIDGAVRLTIPPGTVIPVGKTLHVGRDAVAFRSRATSPTGGEQIFLIHGYAGQLSARGETIELYDDQTNLIDSLTYTGAPTAMQSDLRITEVHYHPADPTAAELLIDPSWTSSEFEFVEVHNIGASTLDIGGAQFIDGIDFTFPGGTMLAPDAYMLIVSNQAAFEARYGNALPVAGEFSGNLSNDGEPLQLLDDIGENILEFTYNDVWYSPTDGKGYSLVFRDDSMGFDQWDFSENWATSCEIHGTPGAPDTAFSTTIGEWAAGEFSEAELLDELISGPDANPDNDEFSNLLEYALGQNPKEHSTGPEGSIESDGGMDYLALSYTRPAKAADVTYIVEVGNDLEDWTEATQVTTIDNGDGTLTLIYRDTEALNPNEGLRRFIRLRVVLD